MLPLQDPSATLLFLTFCIASAMLLPVIGLPTVFAIVSCYQVRLCAYSPGLFKEKPLTFSLVLTLSLFFPIPNTLLASSAPALQLRPPFMRDPMPPPPVAFFSR